MKQSKFSEEQIISILYKARSDEVGFARKVRER
jgi:hypothetical protein